MVVIKLLLYVFAGANSQQQTEIVFTEDDDSCDSHKWGKQTVQQSKTPPNNIHSSHPTCRKSRSSFFLLFSSVFFCIFFS